MNDTHRQEKTNKLATLRDDTMDEFFRNPKAGPIPEPSPEPIQEPVIDQDITIIADLLRKSITVQEEQVILLNNMTKTLTNETPSGTYFDTGSITIDVASPNVLDADAIFSSGSPLIPGYTQVLVHDIMRRNSNKLNVINDGPNTLYVRASDDGKKFSQIEVAILFGEARTFFNVYELRTRSPDASNQFRITEYDYWIAYSAPISISSVVTNRTSFDVRNIAAPVGGVQLPSITVPNGFTATVISNVDNAIAGRIYIATSIANTGIAANRATITPGDSVILTIDNTDKIFVRGNQAALTVDIIVET